MRATLTPRQAEILAFIRETLADDGRPPTRAEVCAAFGFRSPNAAESHLRALAAKGAILLDEGRARGIRLPRSQTPAPPPLLSLPLIGQVSAGSPVFSSEHVEAHYQVDATLFGSRADYLLRVRGLSMRDAGIFDDDLLAVRRQADARNGQIVVARLDDEVTVKRFVQTDGQIALLPANPDFAPLLVAPDREDFCIEGIAVGLIRTGGGFSTRALR